MRPKQLLLFFVTTFCIFVAATSAFAQSGEPVLPSVTGDTQIDNILQWITIVMAILTFVANVLPADLPGVLTLRRLVSNFRSKESEQKSGVGLPLLAFAMFALAIPSTGCSLLEGAKVPDISECAPDKAYLIDNLDKILAGEGWVETLDRVKDEKGDLFVQCALSKFMASDVAMRLKQNALLYMSK